MRSNLTAGLAGLGVLAGAAARSMTGRVGPLEKAVYRKVNRFPEPLHAALWPVMQFGSLGAVGVTSAVAWAGGRRHLAIGLAGSGTAAWYLAKTLKLLTGRGRPSAHLEEVAIRGAPQAGLGFPSGHTAVATALALVGGSHTSVRRAQGLAAVAALVGVARMYVGAHLPLDVIGGAGLGLAAGAAANVVLDR